MRPDSLSTRPPGTGKRTLKRSGSTPGVQRCPLFCRPAWVTNPGRNQRAPKAPSSPGICAHRFITSRGNERRGPRHFAGPLTSAAAQRRFEPIFVKFAMARDLQEQARHERDLSPFVESLRQPVESGASRNDRSPRKARMSAIRRATQPQMRFGRRAGTSAGFTRCHTAPRLSTPRNLRWQRQDRALRGTRTGPAQRAGGRDFSRSFRPRPRCLGQIRRATNLLSSRGDPSGALPGRRGPLPAVDEQL